MIQNNHTSKDIMFADKSISKSVIRNIDHSKFDGLLSQALAHIDDLVVITDKYGIIEYVNPAFEKFTGYTIEEAIGKKSNLLRSGKQSDNQYRSLWNTILDGKTYSAEITNRKKDNNLFYESKTITPIRNSLGDITHFISIGKDITERKELELDFERRWGYLKLLIDNISDIILVVDTEGIIKYGSPSVEASLGYTFDEVTEKNIFSFINNTGSVEIKKVINKDYLGSNSEVNVEFTLNHKNGSQRFFNARVKHLNKGRVIINAHDITDKKISEKDLIENKSLMEKAGTDKSSDLVDILEKLKQEIEWRKELEAQMLNNTDRLELVLDVSEQGIFDFDFITGKNYYNNNFCKNLGYNKSELENFHFEDWFKIIHPDDLWNFKKNLLDHIKLKTEFLQTEVRIITADKETKWIFCRGKITQRDENNAPVRLIGKIENIDLRKKYEQEIKKSYLNEKELNRIKSNFISIVSHEFRTPLSTILSSSDLLRLFGDEFTTDEKEKHFSKIEKSISTLTELLTGVLTLNKTDLKKDYVKTETIEIVGLCKRFIEEVSSHEKRAPKILFNSNMNQKIIQSDKKLLHQIVMNLLNNAVKYNREQNEIKMTLEIGTHILISVEDHGFGIKQEEQANLFSTFFRGTNSNGIPGTGLGLAIVKSSVELLNGEFWLESEYGSGSTFYVKFPIIQGS